MSGNPRQSDVFPHERIGWLVAADDGTLIRIISASARVNGPPLLADSAGAVWSQTGANGGAVPFTEGTP